MAKKRMFSGLLNVWRLMTKSTTESKEGQWLNVPKATRDKESEKREIANKQLKNILLD